MFFPSILLHCNIVCFQNALLQKQSSASILKNSKLRRMLYADGLFSEGQRTMERSAFGRPTLQIVLHSLDPRALGNILKTSQSTIISYCAVRIWLHSATCTIYSFVASLYFMSWWSFIPILAVRFCAQRKQNHGLM